jgi:hypothetical protein
VQKGSALALACRPLVFSGGWRSRPPGGGSLWGPGLGPLYALDKLVRACASSPKISWGGHQILPTPNHGLDPPAPPVVCVCGCGMCPVFAV